MLCLIHFSTFESWLTVYSTVWLFSATPLVFFSLHIMQSWHGNTFPFTDPLCREFTCHWWIPNTKDQPSRSDVNLVVNIILIFWTNSWVIHVKGCYDAHVVLPYWTEMLSCWHLHHPRVVMKVVTTTAFNAYVDGDLSVSMTFSH